jgi:hypothetical protein
VGRARESLRVFIRACRGSGGSGGGRGTVALREVKKFVESDIILGRELGRGGFGVVRKAKLARGGKAALDVAVKVRCWRRGALWCGVHVYHVVRGR